MVYVIMNYGEPLFPLLEPLSEELDGQVADEGRGNGYEKIGSGKNVPHSPGQAPGASLSRTFKFPHQEI